MAQFYHPTTSCCLLSWEGLLELCWKPSDKKPWLVFTRCWEQEWARGRDREGVTGMKRKKQEKTYFSSHRYNKTIHQCRSLHLSACWRAVMWRKSSRPAHENTPSQKHVSHVGSCRTVEKWPECKSKADEGREDCYFGVFGPRWEWVQSEDRHAGHQAWEQGTGRRAMMITQPQMIPGYHTGFLCWETSI